ncbi:hypothetical protein CPB84DRAFT_1846328 [Gymnopilus junonius]|uniref:Uncharacterized protein n=1 Tax=Gymnopilus junonius TaxID=109634 RepID=A0A9P5NSK4_GYMJU|nr:hypothetical protein CPB84DRAFT_1846328 [Gymnopilus junonius]
MDSEFVDAAPALVASARSEVLENLDILEVIFSFLHTSPLSEDRIQTPDSGHLLSASLVKKSFFEPAMNILWRSINSWVVLLCLIPTLVHENGIYATSELIRDEHLERLKLYTRRIRRFRFTPPDYHVSPDVYHFLSRRLDSHLLPTLRTLDFGDVGSVVEKRQAMFLLPSPLVSEVTISDINPSTATFSSSLLLVTGETAPTVHTLALSGRSIDITSLAHITDIVVKHFTALENISFDFDCISTWAGLLDQLSGMKSLKNFSLTLRGGGPGALA